MTPKAPPITKTCSVCGVDFVPRCKRERKRCCRPGCHRVTTCYYCGQPFASTGQVAPAVCREQECRRRLERNRVREYYRRPENVAKVRGWWAANRARALEKARKKQAELAAKGIVKCLTAIRDPNYPYPDSRVKKAKHPDRVCDHYRQGCCTALNPSAPCPYKFQRERPGCPMFTPTETTAALIAAGQPLPGNRRRHVKKRRLSTEGGPGTGSSPASSA